MTQREPQYPSEAYAEEGQTGEQRLWWEISVSPGKKKQSYGAERKLAAWMAFNLREGQIFTIRDLRNALGDEIVPNNDEHLNRRFRQLRKDDWEIPSHLHERALAVGTYRLVAKGWNPAMGDRPSQNAISQNMARRVKDRDGGRCVICGVGSREPYPENDGTAVLTVGHIKSRAAGGSSTDINNLRTECKRCNEPVRNEMRVPETASEIAPEIVRLRREELRRLYSWLNQGFRSRDRLDEIYDRCRMMRADDRSAVLAQLQVMLGVLE